MTAAPGSSKRLTLTGASTALSEQITPAQSLVKNARGALMPSGFQWVDGPLLGEQRLTSHVRSPANRWFLVVTSSTARPDRGRLLAEIRFERFERSVREQDEPDDCDILEPLRQFLISTQGAGLSLVIDLLESRVPKNSLICRILEDMALIKMDDVRDEILEVYRAAFAHPSPAVRDAAALGLLDLGSRAARMLLEHQSAIEDNRNVRNSLRQVLASFPTYAG